MRNQFITVLCMCLAFSSLVKGGGRLLQPVQRSSMWRFPDKFPQMKNIQNPKDDTLNAGGGDAISNGEYGVCGDPITQKRPRNHETGGKFGLFPKLGKGAISACYQPGSNIEVKVQLSKNRQGYFEYDLCVLNTKTDAESEECFRRHKLKERNGKSTYKVTSGENEFGHFVSLPKNVTCDKDSHCVFRWHYVEGDSKEQFWNCADIFISNSCADKVKEFSNEKVSKPSEAPAKKEVSGPEKEDEADSDCSENLDIFGEEDNELGEAKKEEIDSKISKSLRTNHKLAQKKSSTGTGSPSWTIGLAVGGAVVLVVGVLIAVVKRKLARNNDSDTKSALYAVDPSGISTL